jgi:FAD/FMN-containing dehydrogenase
MGAFGATCDNLLAADIVTADGRCVRASADENPDLLWGLRGGGGNFGVVTSFEYQLHPLGPNVVAGMVIHPMSKAREVLRFYREFTAQAPDELTVYAAFLTSPDGALITVMALCYAGSIADGERAVQQLRDFGPPVADMIGAVPYQTHQKSLDPLVPAGRQGYWKGHFLRDLTDEAIETIADHVERMSSPHSIALVEHAHGAISRVGPTETAFPHRTSPYDLVVLSQWDDPSENDKHIAWTRGLFDATRSFSDGGIYVNVLNAGEDERLRAAYGPNYDRLVSLKQKYDPTNFFKMNHNIRPM